MNTTRDKAESETEEDEDPEQLEISFHVLINFLWMKTQPGHC